jgi:putative tricarboxylic transport membrane protein
MAVFNIWQVAALPAMANERIISPRAWPTGVAVIVALAAVAVSLGALLQRWDMVPKDAGSDIGSWRDVLVTLAAILAFVLIVEPLGYLLSSFLLVSGLSLLVSPTKWIRNLFAAAVFAVLSSVLFAGLLGIRLPDGIIPLPWS